MRRTVFIFIALIVLTVAVPFAWVVSCWTLLNIEINGAKAGTYAMVYGGIVTFGYKSSAFPYEGQWRWDTQPFDETSERDIAEYTRKLQFHGFGFAAGTQGMESDIDIPMWSLLLSLIICDWIVWQRLRKPGLRAFPVHA